MSFPGGKNGPGIYQRIINLMPPHRVYIEPFLGSGAILRLKKPAAVNIGIDLERTAVDSAILPAASARLTVVDYLDRKRSPSPPAGTAGASSFALLHGDALEFLRRYPFQGDELVYCDPPYLFAPRDGIGGRNGAGLRPTIRCGERLYTHEFSEAQHLELLSLIQTIRARVILSGYWSNLYAKHLAGWNCLHFEAMTRRGPATEWLWFNFSRPVALHDYRFLGSDYRERENIKRSITRWTKRLKAMPILRRQALLSAIADIGESDGTREPVELAGRDR